MPFNVRSVALAAAVTETGIRAYSTSGDGDIREGCLDLHINDIYNATLTGRRDVVDQADHWFPGELRCACDPRSTLCSFAWASWTQSIFYQTSDDCIREARHNSSWQDTPFLQPDALPGTSMAEVHSRGAGRVIFFFQDNQGYLCCRRALDFDWQVVERLCKAAPCTGIAATTWNDADEVRVYYQDEGHTLCEYRGSFEGSWSYGGLVYNTDKPLGALAAISYVDAVVQVRLYVQEGKDIVEWCKTGDGPGDWFCRHLGVPAIPNTDIVAFKRDISNGVLVNLLWGGPDSILYQRVLAPNLFWLDPTPIGYLNTSSSIIGLWDGNSFNDSTTDDLGLNFTDGTLTRWRGGQDGEYREFVSSEGEGTLEATTDVAEVPDVVEVLTHEGEALPDSVDVGHSLHVPPRRTRRSRLENNTLDSVVDESGSIGNDIQTPNDPCKSLHVPPRRKRRSRLGLNTLESFIYESRALDNDIQTSNDRCKTYEETSASLKREIEDDLRYPADLAIQGINDLIRSVEELYRSANRGPQTSALVAQCKRQGQVVGALFNDLHERSSATMKRFNDLAVDVTYEAATAQTRIKRIDEMLTTATSMRDSVETERQNRLDRVKVAEDHITKARQTKAEAQKNKKESKKGRVIRDIFTLGLGEIGDWGGLKGAIDYANKLISSAENNLHVCQIRLDAATAELDNIDAELKRFNALKEALDGCTTALMNQVTLTEELGAKTSKLTNISLDISVFLGELAAKTETVNVHYSAQQFAESILAIEKLMVTTSVVRLTLTERPEDIQKTLEFIAHSPVTPDDLGDVL